VRRRDRPSRRVLGVGGERGVRRPPAPQRRSGSRCGVAVGVVVPGSRRGPRGEAVGGRVAAAGFARRRAALAAGRGAAAATAHRRRHGLHARSGLVPATPRGGG
jgi:hypothetical protein